MTEKITSLLEKLSLYEGYSNSSASSNQTESQNSKKMTLSTVDEDYFHIKLRDCSAHQWNLLLGMWK